MRFYKKVKGVALLEILVTVALFGLFYVTFLFNFPTLNAVTMYNARISDISSDLRLMQFSGASRGGTISGQYIHGDGMYILNSPTTKSLTFFFDREDGVNMLGVGKSNKYYDSMDITNKVFNFRDFLALSRIRVMAADGTWSDVPVGRYLSVVFARPETESHVSVVNLITAPTFYNAACIEFKFVSLADEINKRSITIEKYGQINSFTTTCK